MLGSRLRRGCVPSKEDARQERSYCGVLDERCVPRDITSISSEVSVTFVPNPSGVGGVGGFLFLALAWSSSSALFARFRNFSRRSVFLSCLVLTCLYPSLSTPSVNPVDPLSGCRGTGSCGRRRPGFLLGFITISLTTSALCSGGVGLLLLACYDWNSCYLGFVFWVPLTADLLLYIR